MPDPRRRKHRTWFIAWAVLCAAGLVVTEALTDSPPADAKPAAVSPECADLITEIEVRIADQRDENASDTALVWTRGTSGPDDDCLDELREYLDAD
ncbi:hypothetical protein ACWIG2_12900 [Streptomyces cellulosae]